MRRTASWVLALGLLLLAAAPASAHASLVSVSPKDGGTLTGAPTKVVLTFDENMRDPSAVVVTGPSGRVDTRDATAVDNTVSVAVRVSEAGRYRIAYRVISADGHPVSGTSSFTFRPPATQASPDASPAPSAGASPDASPAASSDDATESSTGLAVSPWLIGGGVVLALAVVFLLLRPRGGRRS